MSPLHATKAANLHAAKAATFMPQRRQPARRKGGKPECMPHCGKNPVLECRKSRIARLQAKQPF